MTISSDSTKRICTNLLKDILTVHESDNSIKFFRKDLARMTMWLFIISAYFDKKKINIEDLARAIAPTSKISKPSLRLILENAKHKGFIEFTNSKTDQRSWYIEPDEKTIKEFTNWVQTFRDV